MAKYTVTRVYVVDAGSKAEDAVEYIEYTGILEIARDAGWSTSFRSQLIGKR